MPEFATKIFHDLKKHFKMFYDDAGAVGRRYRRMDEIGTPYCITVDGQTLTDQTVTIRDRDTMTQDRVNVGVLVDLLKTKDRRVIPNCVIPTKVGIQVPLWARIHSCKELREPRRGSEIRLAWQCAHHSSERGSILRRGEVFLPLARSQQSACKLEIAFY